MSFREQDWDTLIWCVASPNNGPLKEKAMDEMIGRAGSKDVVTEIVRQRVNGGSWRR